MTNLIGDFSPLRVLPAFSALETDLAHLVFEQGWQTLSTPTTHRLEFLAPRVDFFEKHPSQVNVRDTDLTDEHG